MTRDQAEDQLAIHQLTFSKTKKTKVFHLIANSIVADFPGISSLRSEKDQNLDFSDCFDF